MEHSFGQLAQAAVAKAETIDTNAATIADLTKALAEMTAACKVLTTTNSMLVTALAKCGGKTPTSPPPGFGGTGTAATGHAANTAGVVFPTRIGKNSGNVIFTVPQACSSVRSARCLPSSKGLHGATCKCRKKGSNAGSDHGAESVEGGECK